jgi:hypothetical protein
MAISDRQDDGHKANVDHDPQSRQSDGQDIAIGNPQAATRPSRPCGATSVLHVARHRHLASGGGGPGDLADTIVGVAFDGLELKR